LEDDVEVSGEDAEEGGVKVESDAEGPFFGRLKRKRSFSGRDRLAEDKTKVQGGRD
jgi:hypothetical protein